MKSIEFLKQLFEEGEGAGTDNNAGANIGAKSGADNADNKDSNNAGKDANKDNGGDGGSEKKYSEEDLDRTIKKKIDK